MFPILVYKSYRMIVAKYILIAQFNVQLDSNFHGNNSFVQYF